MSQSERPKKSWFISSPKILRSFQFLVIDWIVLFLSYGQILIVFLFLAYTFNHWTEFSNVLVLRRILNWNLLISHLHFAECLQLSASNETRAFQVLIELIYLKTLALWPPTLRFNKTDFYVTQGISATNFSFCTSTFCHRNGKVLYSFSHPTLDWPKCRWQLGNRKVHKFRSRFEIFCFTQIFMYFQKREANRNPNETMRK